MDLTVDPRSPEPVSAQVRRQVIALVEAGDLAPGERLPTVRSLAERLGLAANTVAKAYRELEAAGVVETRGRHGTFVAASGDARDRAVGEAARDYARRARALGLDEDAAVARLRRVWAAGGNA
jgi:DNA-binding transcriptional regulator YhcF (GntR family)